jgi:four helix bundle protein
MHNFRDLKTWQKAQVLVKNVYILTKKFPKEELFCLTSQIRRAVISIPSNIAEGCGRGTNRQLIAFLDIAQGSSCELETQILLSYDLEYIDKTELDMTLSNLNEIQKMIYAFKDKLSKSLN